MEHATSNARRDGRALAKRLAAIASAGGTVTCRHGGDGSTVVTVIDPSGGEKRHKFAADIDAGAADIELRKIALDCHQWQIAISKRAGEKGRAKLADAKAKLGRMERYLNLD